LEKHNFVNEVQHVDIDENLLNSTEVSFPQVFIPGIDTFDLEWNS
jgi:hypothetical protein